MIRENLDEPELMLTKLFQVCWWQVFCHWQQSPLEKAWYLGEGELSQHLDSFFLSQAVGLQKGHQLLLSVKMRQHHLLQVPERHVDSGVVKSKVLVLEGEDS